MKIRVNFLAKQLALFFFLTISAFTFAQQTELLPQAFHDSIQGKEIQLLDVRSAGEYSQRHIAGSLQADWNNTDQFRERVASLDKEKTLYVYCLAGSRGAAAQKWLLDKGFKSVINLRGGINAWAMEDLPMEGKKDVLQISLDEFTTSIPKDKTVLVDIGAEWCPPCRKMIPVLNELETEGYTIIKIDGGAQTSLAKELKAEEFPTFIVYKNGVETGRLTGVCGKDDLKRIMD